jgi:hypothetical protein
MAKQFDSLSELFNWRKQCPICSKDLVCSIISYDILSEFEAIYDMQFFNDRLKRFKSPLDTSFLKKSKKNNTITQFNSSANEVEIKEINLTFKIDTNTVLTSDIAKSLNKYYLKLFCAHDVIGNAYEAEGSFEIHVEFDDTTVKKINDKFVLQISDIKIDYELYKICNLYLEEEKPNGNLIKITNDYHINKTSFSIANINLDGSFSTFKQNRIDLVKDDFFKFNDPEKVFARLNTIFLLQEKSP